MVANADGKGSAYTNGTSHHGNEDVDTSERDGLHIPTQDAHGYRIHEAPMGTKRAVSVIIMGCGAASLNFFKQSEDVLSNVSIRCYEKNDDIGGTCQ